MFEWKDQAAASFQDPPLRLCPAGIVQVIVCNDMTILKNEGNSQFCPIRMLSRATHGSPRPACLPDLIQVWKTRREPRGKMPKKFGLLHGLAHGSRSSLGLWVLSWMTLTSELGVPGGLGRGRSAAVGLAAGPLLSRPILALTQGQGLGIPFSVPGTQGYRPMYALGT